jgi:predicted Ser/Thr protein kinase
MLNDLNSTLESELVLWIRQSVKTGSNIFSRGYQGNVYLFQGKDQPLILKAPSGWGFGKFVRMAMLRNEYRVYKRLSKLKGIPKCYGLLDGRYLVLEYVNGTPIRSAEITHHKMFFDALLHLIKELHKAGVAHTDLKKKDNLLVVEGKTPCVIDFGVAVIRKPGFAPLNHYLYNLASQFDFNAWVKLKYGGMYEKVDEQDKKYYKRTIVEKVSRWIKDNILQ